MGLKPGVRAPLTVSSSSHQTLPKGMSNSPAAGDQLMEVTSSPIIDPSCFWIVTRFAYRFKADDPLAPLVAREVWQRRLEIFQRFCLPSILGQTNPAFGWILIIDVLLPTEQREELVAILQKALGIAATLQRQPLQRHNEILLPEWPSFINSTPIGPRWIYLHPWCHDDQLGRTEWLQRCWQEQRHQMAWGAGPSLLITTRLDNDDSLNRHFTNYVWEIAQREEARMEGFLLVSFSRGYFWYSSGAGRFQAQDLPLIALGLTLMVREVQRYPLTVYFGRHTQLLQYLRQPELNGSLRLLGVTPLLPIARRYLLLRRTPPMYIRTVHQDSLEQRSKMKTTEAQRNGTIKPPRLATATTSSWPPTIKKYFQLDN